MRRTLKRTFTRTFASLVMIAAFAGAIDTSASATGQRMHKPFAAFRTGGFEPPDPCLTARSGRARCTADFHHVGNGGGSGK